MLPLDSSTLVVISSLFGLIIVSKFILISVNVGLDIFKKVLD